MNMKRIALTVLSATTFAMLAACGGGGGSNDGAGTNTGGTTTPPAGAQVSGKAIDGYLAGAAVCFDNGQGVCDSTLPSTTTDANGNYSLPASGNLLGKTLLVTVTPQTKDLSRPGYTFPASFTLSQIVTTDGAQNISPISTLVSAQMQTGLTQAQAVAAVSQLLGGDVDPNADYIASGNTTVATTAAAIVDKVTSLATSGAVDPATVRNTMNAIVAKGDVASVTASDVQAQASKPVYAGVDAASVLSGATYALNGYLVSFSGGYAPGTNNQAVVEDVRQVSGGVLTTTQQEFVGGQWQQPPAGKYDNMSGVYELKNDASWSGFVSLAQYKAGLPVTASGAFFTGTDPNTGIGFTYEYRSVDLGNQALATAVPTNFGLFNLWTLPALTGTNFTAPSTAYVGLLSYSTDQVILPLWLPPCPSPTIQNGLVCGFLPAASEDGQIAPVLGNASTNYLSIQQAIGVPVTGQSGALSIVPMADGSIQYTDPMTSAVSTVGTWSVYSRNSDLLVFDIDPAKLTNSNDAFLTPLANGAKIVVALRNTHLRMGWLYPSTYAQKTYQFTGSLNAQLLQGVQQAVASMQ